MFARFELLANIVILCEHQKQLAVSGIASLHVICNPLQG